MLCQIRWSVAWDSKRTTLLLSLRPQLTTTRRVCGAVSIQWTGAWEDLPSFLRPVVYVKLSADQRRMSTCLSQGGAETIDCSCPLGNHLPDLRWMSHLIAGTKQVSNSWLVHNSSKGLISATEVCTFENHHTLSQRWHADGDQYSPPVGLVHWY